MAVNPEAGTDLHTAADQIAGILAEPEGTAAPDETPPDSRPEADPEPVEVEEKAKAEPSQEPTAEQEAEPESQEEPERHTIKVNGEESKVTLDELKDGYQRDSDYRQKTADLADRGRQFDAAVEQARQELTQRLTTAQELNASLESELGLNEQPPDWDALKEQDPEGYMLTREAYRQRQEEATARRGKIAEATAYSKREQEARWQQHVEVNQKKLAEGWPEYADAKTRDGAMKEVLDYAQEAGFNNQELAFLVDHRQVNILRDAMAYRKLLESKPEVEKKLRAAPKMTKPGSPQGKQDKAVENFESSLKQLRRNPKSIDAAAAAFGSLASG